MKKIVFLLLVLVSLMLTACAKQAGSATQTPQTQSQSSSTDAVEITYNTWGDLAEQAVWQAMADDFNAANPDIKVKIDVSDQETYWEKLDGLFASQTPPDVFAMDTALYPDWQSRGMLLNLQPYIDATPGLLDGLFKNPLKVYQRDDGYYGLPRDFQATVMFYNKDLFDQAGLPYPSKDWTWDDLRAMAQTLTVDENGDGIPEQYGFACDLSDMEQCWSEAIWSYGGEVVNDDHTKTLIAEPAARQAWKLFYDMTFVDQSMPDSQALAELGDDPFKTGKVAMTPMDHSTMPGYADTDFQWDVLVMPAGPATQATSLDTTGLVVSKDSPYPNEAWEFIKYVLSPQGQKHLTQLGRTVPVNKLVAESPYFMDQKVGDQIIYQEAFLESLGFVRIKPSFEGFNAWSDAVTNGMAPIWSGEADLDATLDQVVIDANKILVEK